MRTKKFLAMAIALGLAVGATAMPTLAAEKKTLVFGDTTFNAENEEADINPQNTYAGWACIRYGVGETLFRYSDTMEIEPWIAKEYENIDELTWKITLNDGVVFSNGRACDGDNTGFFRRNRRQQIWPARHDRSFRISSHSFRCLCHYKIWRY